MTLVSIIIPVYCVEKYIEKCIVSVVNQTYSNIEILIVNDGSPDASRSICEKYAQKDNRIKIIDQNNGGLSNARNTGIRHATGEYIFFLDSDDWIELDTIEFLVRQLEQHDADISICGVNEVAASTTRRWPPAEQTLSNIEALQELYQNGEKICVTVWNKLYRRKIFEHLQFEDKKIHEDVFFTPKALYFASRVAVNTEPRYNYLITRPNSICNQPIHEKRLDAIDAHVSNAIFFEAHSEQLFSTHHWTTAFLQCAFFYCQSIHTKNIPLSTVFKNRFNALYRSYKQKTSKNIKTRAKISLFRFFPMGYYFLWYFRHFK